MKAALHKINRPTHVILTVPNRGCRAGCLAEWLQRLGQARRMFLQRNQKHRSLGVIPVLDWYLWKIEVTWSQEHSWWHPHIHILADDWLTRPFPPGCQKQSTTHTYNRVASYLRFRWADCLRKSGLPTPRYPHSWIPGDLSPRSLSQLAKIVSWDPKTSNRSDVLTELAKYVTKPQVLQSFSPELSDEYGQALGEHPHQIRTWQPRRGWLEPQKKGDDTWLYVGTLGRLRDPHMSSKNPSDYYLALEISNRLRELLLTERTRNVTS